MNTYVKAEPEQKKSFLSHVAEYKFNFSTSNEWALQYLPYFIFITILGVLYIANTYYSERVITEITKLDKEVDVLKRDYSTLKYQYIYHSKQTEIAKKVRGLGLIENDEPVIKIQVESLTD